MDKRTWCVALVVIGSLSGFGCSKKTSATGDAGSAGTGGTSATAGTGGGTAGTTTTPTGGTGGRMGVVVKNIPCGQTKCAEADPMASNSMMMMTIGFKLANSCCADEANSVCGTVDSTSTDGMTPCDAPQVAAPKCPKTFGMSGCCVAGTNLCGADLSLTGMGCEELGKFGMMIPSFARNFIMVPPPTMCDGTPVPQPDAGTTKEDAGM